MKLKVLHLNASEKGGASIVAQRLNDALNHYTDIESKHLIFEGNIEGLNQTYLWANTPVKRGWAKLNHALDKFDFLRFEREARIRFQFNHARIGVDISMHPLVQEADIIHIHWILKGFLSFVTLRKLLAIGKPVVWTCHDLWPFTGGCFHMRGCDQLPKGCGNCPYLFNPEANDSSTHWLQVKKQLFQINRPTWVAPSAWLAKEVESSLVLRKEESFHIIPNAISVKEFSVLSIEGKKAERHKLGLDESRFTLLFVAASLDNTAKGYKDFEALCNSLNKDKFQAIIVGKSSEEPKLEIECKYLGYVTDSNVMKQVFGASDLYITTSYEDNLPTTVMESLAHGVPAMGYAIGGIPELIKSGETGFVVPKGQWMEMKDIILGLSEDYSRWQEWSLKARSKAESEYDETKVAEAYASVYHQLK